MKTINIYISKDQRKQIDELKVKYQLSLTTIIDVLCEITWDTLFCNADKELEEKFKNKHMYVLTNKTSIKTPKFIKDKELEHPNRYINNCLQAYLNKNIVQYVKNDVLNAKHGYWNRINQELTKRTDNWWKYNEYMRYQRRYDTQMKKENK